MIEFDIWRLDWGEAKVRGIKKNKDHKRDVEMLQ